MISTIVHYMQQYLDVKTFFFLVAASVASIAPTFTLLPNREVKPVAVEKNAAFEKMVEKKDSEIMQLKNEILTGHK